MGIEASKTAYRKYRTDGFATPSGKVELASERLREQGHEAVPYLKGWQGNPISFADRSHEFSMIGISGARTGQFTHSQYHTIPSLLEREPEGYADLHPVDARAMQVVAGDLLKIETPRGHIRMKARMSEAVHLGSVRIGWCWGGANPDVNLNNLTDDDARNPVTGTPSNRSFMYRVEKV